MAISNYLENKILEATLKGISYSSPTAVYLCLYTTDPTDTDNGVEVGGLGYERQLITFGNASNGIITNSEDIRFPIAQGDWGTVTHIGIRDSLTQGNLLYHGILNVAQTILASNQLVVTPGQLRITLD